MKFQILNILVYGGNATFLLGSSVSMSSGTQ